MPIADKLGSAMLLCALAACGPGGARPPASSSPAPSPGTGEFLERSLRSEAGTRSYRLYVPSGYDGRRQAPLLVMLHGCTQDPLDFAAGTRMNELAEEHTLLVVYPEQPASVNPQRCWNWYVPEHQGRDRGEPAVIAGMVGAVRAAYRVDARRIYVAGISAGGAMSLVMAVAYPDLFAAAGSHSGIGYAFARTLQEGLQAMRTGIPSGDNAAQRVLEAMGPRGRPAPLIVFQGGADPVVNPANAEAIIGQWIGAHAALARTRARAANHRREGRSSAGSSYTVTVARAGGRVTTECWMVRDLGHAWSGGAPAGTFTDASGPDASREMVRFFLEHPRR